MARSFNLRQDSTELLRRQWLRPDERLVMYTPTWGRLPRLEGIPKPGLTLGLVLMKILRGIGKTVGFIFILALMAAADGGDWSGGSRKRPGIVARGRGRDSIAAQVLHPTFRRKGIWVLTERRLAFLEVRGDIQWESLSDTSDQHKSQMDKDAPAEVTLTPLVELPEGQFHHGGVIARTGKRLLTRRAWTVGQYHQIGFADGSELHLRDRRK